MDKREKELDKPFLADHPLTTLHLHIERYGVRNLTPEWKASNRLVLDSKLYWVAKGSGMLRMDHQNFRLAPGKIYFLPGGTVQSFGTEDGLSLHWLHFRCALINSISINRCFEFKNELPEEKIPDIEARLRNIREEHARFIKSRHPGALLSAHGQLLSLLACFIRSAAEREYGKDFERLKKAVRFIDEHINEAIRVEELAVLCGLERTYFSTLFKKTLNCSPQAFINHRRIQFIAPYLSQPHLLIEEIAEKSGFPDVYYFSRFFKKNTGLSPTEYRKKQREALP